ncbi:MAG: metallophosphoesterase [Gammaproteobacteria bacterium]
MNLQRSRHKDDRPLFTFVVVADTHVNESDESSTSPFETNRLANVRARHVFREIAAMQPAPKFVIHLGDIVHPVPSLPIFQDAVSIFKEITEPLAVPLYVIPGNHDVGDKRIDWMPAEQVCDDYLETYREAFGKDFYSFDEGATRFVMLNSLLPNSGLADEARQQQWLEEQIAQAGERRVFIFMHYPPYIYAADEPGNYDNIDEPARSWVLTQMRKPHVEAVFAGHVHNFWYDRVGEAEFYMLPSTAFLRHDFSEFYRVAPDIEFARGDVERFGYFVVDVFEEGHVAYSIRTMGRQAARGEAAPPVRNEYVAHPKTSGFDRVGVELRHPWAEAMQITSTGGVQEFGRKWARNDYPLLALWEMGVRLSKVPDIDLRERQSRSRMQMEARLGHRFIVTTLGAPRPELGSLAHDAGVAGFEVNVTLDGFNKQLIALAGVRTETGIKIYFSKILSVDDSRFDGKHFTHFVQAGFTVEELSRYRDVIAEALHRGAIDGVTVRLDADEALIPAANSIAAWAVEQNCRVLVSLKLSGPSVAKARTDDRATVASVAQAMVLSQTSERLCYVFDTFMDVDRGYYPRHAFIDRRFNPRPPARAFTTLNAVLSHLGALSIASHDTGGAERVIFHGSGQSFALICGRTSATLAELGQLPGSAQAFDLAAGEQCTTEQTMEAITWRTDRDWLETFLIRLG